MGITDGLRKIKRRQLVDEVIIQLQEYISSGVYKIGTKIPPEPELVSQLGVSRTTVREAVRVLSNAGLLDVRQGDGTYVRAHSTEVEPLERRLRRANILEVYEIRQILEISTAKYAALRRTEGDLEKMRASLEKRIEARKAGNTLEYIDSDIAFHNAIAVAGKNSLLTDLYLGFSNVVRNALTKVIEDPQSLDFDIILDSHRQLLRAIEEQKVEDAQEWAAKHLDMVMNSFANIAKK